MANDLIAGLRRRLQAGNDPTVVAEIERAILGRRGRQGGHTDWGLLCEEAGLVKLAFREFQLALRDDPKDATAAYRLAHYYRERGDLGRAAQMLERILAADPAREEWLSLLADILREEGALPRLRSVLQRAVKHGLPQSKADALLRRRAGEREEEDEDAAELTPTDADCVRFQTLFSGREDVHARQWARQGGDTGYAPVQEPLTPAVVRNHLLGTYTVGVYPIRLDGTCTFFAIDLDIDRGALEKAHGDPDYARLLRDTIRSEGVRLYRVLADLGLPPLLEDSGFKGRHLWVFLARPESAEVLHMFGRLFVGWQSPMLRRGIHLEFFPKQPGRSGKGFGNLIKLPLGIHRRTGRRALLLDDRGRPLSKPLEHLRHIQRVSQDVLYRAIERLKALSPGKVTAPADEAKPVRPVEAKPATPTPTGPPPPAPLAEWTEADFETDARVRHILQQCPVLAELKRTVDEHRRLSHNEQIVLIHTLGHLEGGPQAVNYLFRKCVDVGPEKFMKDRHKGNPISCASIRRKIGHVTRRVPCNCPFDFAPDRYPTPVLHLLTLPSEAAQTPPNRDDPQVLAQRFAVLERRLHEITEEYRRLRRSLTNHLRVAPDRTIACPGGKYRLVESQGVEELRWEPDALADTD